MNRETFYNLFREACTNFKQNECVRFISETSTEIVSYSEMEFMIEEFGVYCEEWTDQCVGIVCNNLDPQIVAIMMSLMKAEASFVFIDVSSSNFISVVDRLNTRWFVVNEEISVFGDSATTPDALAVKNDLSSTKHYKRYRILERKITPPRNESPGIAFVAFSSGSTGPSKIIRIPFRSILPNVIDLKNIYKLHQSDTIYVSAPPTFDPCILDIFLALSTGCRLLLASTSVKFDEKILTNIFSSLATVCYLTPSVFANTFPKGMANTSLRILTFGGEPFPNLDSAMYPCLRNVNVYNVYGTTEVSCWASIDLVSDLKNASLGTPLSDTVFEVRNRRGDDDIGELFIGSYNRVCLLEDEEDSGLTRPCFRASGDIVEVKDGRYFYVGRTDRRVKILGHKVDLASIDGVLLSSHLLVNRSRSVLVRDENLIVIFVVLLSHSDDVTVEIIETFLRQQFPAHVVPYRVFIVAEIPLNKHGKVCEKACEQLYHTLKTRQHGMDLAGEFELLWRRYTSRDNVVRENTGFVECGGNSMLALQFTAALANVGRRVPNDFIVALLSNAKYSRCLEMIVSAGPPSHKRCLKESDAQESSKVAKLERYLGRLERVMSRGKTEMMAVDGNELDAGASSAGGTVGSMRVKWRHNMAKCVDASPTVLAYEKESIVICGSHSGQLLFVETESGRILKRITLPDRIESSACASSCGKYVFVGCYDHKMYCIEVRGGVIEWTFETGEMVKSSAVYFDEKLYFGSYDHYFYCVSREGRLLWKTNVDESSIYASAIVEKNVIVVATLGGTVAFLEHDGSVKDRLCFEKPYFSSPCTITSHLCITVDVTGVVRMLDTISGKQVWQYEVDGNVFSGVSRYKIDERERIVFGCHDERVYCLEIDEKGACLGWRLEVHSPVYATPFCYANSIGSSVLVATTAGHIYIVDAIDGAVTKSCSVEGNVFSSPVVVLESALAIFGCRNNHLYALDIS